MGDNEGKKIKLSTVFGIVATIVPSTIAFVWWAVDVQMTIHELKRQADVAYPIILEYNVQKEVAARTGTEFQPFVNDPVAILPPDDNHGSEPPADVEEQDPPPRAPRPVSNVPNRISKDDLEKIRRTQDDRLQEKIRPRSKR